MKSALWKSLTEEFDRIKSLLGNATGGDWRATSAGLVSTERQIVKPVVRDASASTHDLVLIAGAIRALPSLLRIARAAVAYRVTHYEEQVADDAFCDAFRASKPEQTRVARARSRAVKATAQSHAALFSAIDEAR